MEGADIMINNLLRNSVVAVTSVALFSTSAFATFRVVQASNQQESPNELPTLKVVTEKIAPSELTQEIEEIIVEEEELVDEPTLTEVSSSLSISVPSTLPMASPKMTEKLEDDDKVEVLEVHEDEDENSNEIEDEDEDIDEDQNDKNDD